MITYQTQWKNSDQSSCPASTGKQQCMKLTGPVTFIYMNLKIFQDWDSRILLSTQLIGDRTSCNTEVIGLVIWNYSLITPCFVLQSVLLPLLIVPKNSSDIKMKEKSTYSNIPLILPTLPLPHFLCPGMFAFLPNLQPPLWKNRGSASALPFLLLWANWSVRAGMDNTGSGYKLAFFVYLFSIAVM